MSLKKESRSGAFIESLRAGSTFRNALAESGLQREHAKLLLEHLKRTGLLAERTSRVNLGSFATCDEGACSPGVKLIELNEKQRLHCVGCPLSGF